MLAGMSDSKNPDPYYSSVTQIQIVVGNASVIQINPVVDNICSYNNNFDIGKNDSYFSDGRLQNIRQKLGC